MKNKNLKVLVDFEKIKDPYSGLGQFCLHLKKQFDLLAPQELKLQYFRPKGVQKISKHIPIFIPKSDVFHAVHQDSPYCPWDAWGTKKTKYILTIHDLNALYEKSDYGSGDGYRKILQQKIDRAEVVTFISEFARNEVKKYFKIDLNKTHIIYNGIALEDQSLQPKIVPSGPFLFSVGTVLPKKNFHVLIDFLKLVPDYQFILAGTTYHSYAKEMQKRIMEEKLSDRFFMVGTISDAEKRWYYEHASAFFFPSLLEGFGLPVAEAQSLGLPLFLSKHTSLPEIGGKHAFYFDNFSPGHMKEIFIEGMKKNSSDLKEKLILDSKRFSWENAAQKYLSLYSSI